MINNDIANHLNRYFNRSGNTGDATSGSAADIIKKRLKQRADAMTGKSSDAQPTEQEETKTAAAQNGIFGKHKLYTRGKDKNGAVESDAKKNKNGNQQKTDTAAAEEEELTPMQRRERELKAIMDRLNAEESQRYPNRNQKKETSEKTETTDASSNVGVTTSDGTSGSGGIEGFLNDMPLFNEFKTGLMDAFKMLDSASAGSISAQYELNYTTMQHVMNEAGDYEYKETSVNIKLDLNYIKAAAGGQTGKELSDAIGKSEDFASLVENLQNVANNQQSTQQTGKTPSPQDFMASMQDYFSPEKTADRIVDFSTAFFGMSDSFKKHGDTEEGRAEFAETMRKAIQKGFDQAMGTLGKVPKATQDGIDKTHELVFKGIDDFVKNGYNKNKQDQGVYNSLEQFGMNFQMSYSSKTVSVSKTSSSSAAAANANNRGNDYYNQAYGKKPEEAAAKGVDAEA